MDGELIKALRHRFSKIETMMQAIHIKYQFIYWFISTSKMLPYWHLFGHKFDDVTQIHIIKLYINTYISAAYITDHISLLRHFLVIMPVQPLHSFIWLFASLRNYYSSTWYILLKFISSLTITESKVVLKFSLEDHRTQCIVKKFFHHLIILA